MAEQPAAVGGVAGRLGDTLRAAAERLAEAGVASPRTDAELLAAHVLGKPRAQVAAEAARGAAEPEGFAGAFEQLVAERARRVPLQHLVGQAPFRGNELEVGPGVFVPRPETELLAGLAIRELHRLTAPPSPAPVSAEPPAAPLAVDLGTGSGAIALALATEAPGSRVWAVEVDALAHAWAARNLAGSGVHLVLADAAEALPDLDGRVDVVVTNPPYVPDDARPVDVEVAEHDPPKALYGGPDGLTIPAAMVRAAARLLHPGGLLLLEHGEDQRRAVARLLPAPGWTDVEAHRDLTGRWRVTTARLAVGGRGTPDAGPKAPPLAHRVPDSKT